MEMNIVIAGEAGQGAFSVELELTETLSRLNIHFFATKHYMSRVRGGHNYHMIRIADHPVHALRGGKWDMVVALDGETERLHKPNLREGGIYLSREMTNEIGAAAKEAFGNIAASNSILVGIVLAVIGVSPEKAAEAAEPGKEEYLKKGFEFAARWKLTGALPVSARAGKHRKFDGNQALALGAILGGCQFMAGYPMTPATSILDYFSKAASSLPIHFEQAEDEIAAINMVLGASYAGVRSMAATSGGGFALMQEAVSLAGMTETPVVIAVSQRPGPATGLPTRTEQADLHFVLQRRSRRIPADHLRPRLHRGDDRPDQEELRACGPLPDSRFHSDGSVLRRFRPDLRGGDPAGRREPGIPGVRPDLQAISTDRGRHFSPDLPRTFGGPGQAGLRRARRRGENHGGSEACGSAWWTSDGRKSSLLQKEAVSPTFYGDRDAASFILCWGSTKHIVKEAAERLTGEGIPVAVLHFGQVYPLTPEMVAPYSARSKRG